MKRLKRIAIALVCSAFLVGGLDAVARDVHKHTPHSCHKRPHEQHTCAHSLAYKAKAWPDSPAPDCFPCEDCGCSPYECGSVGGMLSWLKAAKVRYFGV
jgi:hypothetical protein